MAFFFYFSARIICLLAFGIIVVTRANQLINTTIYPNLISEWTISPHLLGMSIEFLNHEIYGNGLYSQMIFGESFEEQAGKITPSPKLLTFASESNGNLYLRNCENELFVTDLETDMNWRPMDEFLWKPYSPAFNAMPDSLTFASWSNTPRQFMCVVPKNQNNGSVENTRLGAFSTNEFTADFVNAMSFEIVSPGLSNHPNSISLLQAHGAYAGMYAVINDELSGNCASQFVSPASDVILTNLSLITNTSKASWFVDEYAYPVSENGYFGCGNGRTNDSNLVQQISLMWMAWYSTEQLQTRFDTNILQTFNVYTLINDSSTAFNGIQYQRINFSSALMNANPNLKTVGVANFGLNCQLGSYIVANELYTGYMYVRNVLLMMNTGDSADIDNVQIRVSLVDTKNAVNASADTRITLDSVIITLIDNGGWQRYNFTFHSITSNTSCAAVVNPENLTEAMYSCSGAFVVELLTMGSVVDIDYTYLENQNNTLMSMPVRADMAEMLRNNGMAVLRMGGRMCNVDEYRWKSFRGLRAYRQPYSGYWYSQQWMRGQTQTRGFGIFEIIDLCAAIDCIPIITFNNNESIADMTDFIEYCYGNINTEYGRLRIVNDSHPEIYNVSWVEIGHEQALTQLFLSQMLQITQAMDDKVRRMNADLETQNNVRIPLFDYCVGQNLQPSQLRNESALVEKYITSLAYLTDRIYWDLHVNGEPYSAPLWNQMIADFQRTVQSLNSQMRVVILEENGGDHGLFRGIGHAAFNQIFVNYGDFARVHGYANAIQAWQGMDFADVAPQGQLFYLPNMTFGQTVYWVNKVIADTIEPHYVYTYGEEQLAMGGLNITTASSKPIPVVSVNVNGDEDEDENEDDNLLAMNISVFFANYNDVGCSGFNFDIQLRISDDSPNDTNNNNGSMRISVERMGANLIASKTSHRHSTVIDNRVLLTIIEGETGVNDEQNTVWETDRIYPTQKEVPFNETFTVFHNSFVVAQFRLQIEQ